MRRNWPDLLIAIALVAVIAGIIATLLSGGSLLPRVGNTNTTTRSAANTSNLNQNSTTTSTAVTTDSLLTQPTSVRPSPYNTTLNTTTLSSVDPVSVVNSGTSGSTTGTSASTTGAASLADPISSGRNSSSLAGAVSADINNSLASAANAATPTATPTATSTVNTRLSIVPESSVTAALPSTSVITPAGSAVVPASGVGTVSMTPLPNMVNPKPVASGGYKISVGAFSVVENARNLGEKLANQGYPVSFDQRNNLTIVAVGPYADRTQADGVAQQLTQMGLSTNVYENTQVVSTQAASSTQAVQGNVALSQVPLNNQALGNQATQTTQFSNQFSTQTTAQSFNNTSVISPATTTTTTTNPTSSAATTAIATSSSPSYLQVGAYKTVESSLPHRVRLENYGYTVYTQNQGGFYKLLIGPFQPSELNLVSTQLKNQGIENFPVR
ncbi:MAG: SPOR domain-containing protein [Deinococcales bacterium]